MEQHPWSTGRARFRTSRFFILAMFVLLTHVLGASAAIADESAPAASAESRPAPEHRGSAFVDPLGLLMFGPRVGVEAGGARLTGALYARWFNAGLLGQSLFVNDGDRFAFSYGIGARGRYYVGEGQGGLHVGAGAEYLRSRIKDEAALIMTTSGYLVPYAEGGYRLAFDRFYADASLALGYAARVSGRVDNLPGGSSAALYEATNKSSVYGSVGLELGVFF